MRSQPIIFVIDDCISTNYHNENKNLSFLRRYDISTALIPVAYPIAWVLAHKAAVLMNVAPGVSVWYPPAGLTFAFLLHFPKLWPLAFVGIGYVVLENPYVTTSLGTVLSWLIPPTGYVIGAMLLRRSVGSLNLQEQSHIHRFILASVGTAGTVAVINVLNFCIDGAIPWDSYWSTVARFFIGDAIGLVTLTPFLLLIGQQGRTTLGRHSFWKLSLGLAAAAAIIYLEVAELLLGTDQGRFSYFVMVPVAWMAVVFGAPGAALSTLLANVSITLAGLIDPDQQVVAGAPYFMLSMGYLALILAGTVEAREGALRRLRRQEMTLDKAYRHFTNQQSASKLAHEVKQPLSCISTYAQGLHSMVQSGRLKHEELPWLAERLYREALRMREIIAVNQERRDQEGGQHEALAVRVVLLDVIPLLRQISDDHGVALAVDIEACVGSIRGNATTLQQLVVNLVRNACEAMSGPSEPKNRRLRLAARDEGDRVLISVEDRGPGFPNHIIDLGHALFASTTPDGSGFGLPIARAIALAHGGDISLANTKDGGTVTCWLPRIDEPAHAY